MTKRAVLIMMLASALFACKLLKKKDPYEKVALGALQTEYRSDEGKAATKYNGKFLRVSGVVNSTLDTDTADWIFVNTHLIPPGSGNIFDRRHIICKLKAKSQMAYGVKGTTITIKGYNAGPHPFSKNFQFEDCIVENKPDTAAAEKQPAKYPLPE